MGMRFGSYGLPNAVSYSKIAEYEPFETLTPQKIWGFDVTVDNVQMVELMQTVFQIAWEKTLKAAAVRRPNTLLLIEFDTVIVHDNVEGDR